MSIRTFVSRSAAILALLGLGFAVAAPAIADNHRGGGMMEPDPMPGSISDPMSGSMEPSIVGIATSNGSFETLTQALQAADLVSTLNGPGPYTVFAPTDEAFDELPDGALEFLLQPENRNILQQVLTYHVVPGEIMAGDLSTGGIDALSGGIAVRVTPDRVIINNGSVIDANIDASNGVIHAVNRVLIPSQIRQQLVAQLSN